jgi:signal transduction histidine kinase
MLDRRRRSGIPADRLETVFDKMETDPNKKSGMGLGLAIVRQFVEAHGGRVSVESELGGARRFDSRFLRMGRER